MTSKPTATPQQVGEHYDRTADLVGSLMGDHLHCGYWATDEDDSTLAEAALHFTDVMIARLAAAAEDTVLDVGCGVGGPAVRLATTSRCQVTGITISEEQVRHATSLAQAAGLSDRMRFRHGDAMTLPFEAASFDAAWALESLFHMPDRSRALGEIARVVRPGGRLVCTDFVDREAASNAAALDAVFGTAPPTVPEYLRLVAASGFEVVEATDITAQTLSRSHREFAEAVATQRTAYENAAGGMVSDFAPSPAAPPAMGYLLVVARRSA